MERAQTLGTELDLERKLQEWPGASRHLRGATLSQLRVRCHGEYQKSQDTGRGVRVGTALLCPFSEAPTCGAPTPCSQGDQVTARSNASFKGTSRLEAEVQLDCRVFPSGPGAATGARGAPKTASTSSERGAKTKTSQDSCHFRRLEECRSHATH